jgi:hypothetical protein
VFLLRRHWLEILTGRLEFNQPFYYLIMHFWARAFGESEFSLRFPSAAFGVATVFITFMLTRHLVNVWIALGATLLVAVSPVLIWYSQEARLYAFTTFLLLVSTYLLIRYLETIFQYQIANGKGNHSFQAFEKQPACRSCCRECCGIEHTAIEKDATLGFGWYHRLLAGCLPGFAGLRRSARPGRALFL